MLHICGKGPPVASGVHVVQVELERVLDVARIGMAWEMYTSAFAQLRIAAVQRHVMTRREFDELMTDKRVMKYLAVDPATGRLAGLATVTNDLEAMPLISPDYFAHRWPEQYAQQRIWYLGFFALEPAFRGDGTFELVIARMWEEVQVDGGVAALDVCAFNTALGLPVAIRRTLQALSPHVVTEQLDAQTYWSFELATSC